MADQAKKIETLLDYFSGYEFDSRCLEEIGLFDKNRYNAFKKAYCLENDLPLSTKYFSFSPKEMGNFIKVRPEFKRAITFLSHMMLPLQIKRLELGLDLNSNEKTTDFFKKMCRKSATSKFKQDKDIRWQTYLSVIGETIKALRDEKRFQSNDEKQTKLDVIKARKRAQFLDDNLHELLKGTGEYFFAKEAIWTVQDDDNGELITAFKNLSKLFNPSETLINRDDIFNKEKDVLDLAARAVIWHPTDDVEGKTALFDRFIDLKDKVQSMKNDEEYAMEVSNAEQERKEKRAQILKRAYQNKTYTSLTCSSFFPLLFLKLGLMNSKELITLIVNLSLYITLFSPESAPNGSEEHFDREEKEGNNVEKREVRINVGEFQMPFYRPGFKRLTTDICNHMSKQGFFKHFDFETCYDVLETMAPISFLKLCEWDDYFYKVNNGKEVLREKSKYGKKPLNKWNDVQKMDFLVSCICSTVQDLRDEKTPRALKDAEDTQGNMEYILQGVPEYWFNHYLEQINYYYAKKGNPNSMYCAKVLLDDMSEYFNFENASVTKESMPERMSELKNLANMAIYINPNWTNDEKDELWDCVHQMNIPDVPRIILRAENPKKENGNEKTHE